MDITIEDGAACRKTLKISVPPEDVQATFDEIVAEYKKSATIPGYRKGRAPETLIRNRYKKQIVEAVREEIVPKCFRKAVEENDLQIANVLDASQPDVVLGEGLSFDVELDVVPSFELPTYKGVEVTREREEIDDDKVNEVLDNLRENFVTFEDRGEGEHVAEHDLVQISYTATLDGKPLAEAEVEEGDELPAIFTGQKDFWTQANEAMGRGEGPSVIPGLGTVLVGLAIGDSTDTDVEFEEDCPMTFLQGKTVNYQVTVGAARARIVPEMSDEIAEKMGMETVEKLTEDIRENLEKQADENAEAKVRNDVVEAVMSDLEFELPESIVASETQDEIYSTVSRYSQQGVPEESITEHKGEIFDQASETVKRRLRLQYVCRQIAKAEDITANRREMDSEIKRIAQSTGLDIAEVLKRLKANGRLESIETDILVRKTIDFLVEQASIQG